LFRREIKHATDQQQQCEQRLRLGVERIEVGKKAFVSECEKQQDACNKLHRQPILPQPGHEQPHGSKQRRDMYKSKESDVKQHRAEKQFVQ
jgi:hypothetical protein